MATATRGDRQLDQPLHTVKDPDFFSSEIDNLLLDGEVDLAVHAMKDLPERRPQDIALAAIPPRENPRDVVLLGPDVEDKLRSGKPLKLGSCSARRHHNAAGFLPQALPRCGPPARIELADLRGGVDARVARLHSTGADRLDGVVLALAGLARLWNDPETRPLLAPSLSGIRWVVLPLSSCPAAPAQGALALECRTGATDIRRLAEKLHDASTYRRVLAERSVAGAGQTIDGATAIMDPELGQLLWHGRTQTDLVPGPALHWQRPPPPRGGRAWDAGLTAREPDFHPIPVPTNVEESSAVFVAHWRALPADTDWLRGKRVWVSGEVSWRQLAARGVWVEGCAENLGYASLQTTLEAPVLGLPAAASWCVLTHRDAVSSWARPGWPRAFPTYARSPEARVPDAIDTAALSESKYFFWGSPQQYAAHRPWLPPTAHHACGPGKTLDYLRGQGVANLSVFPSRLEWQRWLG